MSFTLYPAIDIRGGKCVRLFQGDYNLESKYYDNPLEPAIKWAKSGADWLHIIDLDGAKTGEPVNIDLIQKILKTIDIKIQIGGGIRSKTTAKAYLDQGATRVILGSVALSNIPLVKELLDQYGPERVIVSLDGRQGKALKEGWLDQSGATLQEAAINLGQIGIKTFIYTDVEKDGTLEGPNREEALNLAKATGKEIIVAGGIGSNKDVLELSSFRNQGIGGAIIGRALYTGDVNLAELLEQTKGGN